MGYMKDAGGRRLDEFKAAPAEVNVAIRSRVGNNQSNGTDTSQTSRLRFVLRGGVGTIRLVFTNFYLPAGGTEPVNASDVTVKASIENPGSTSGDSTGAAVIPVFFGGARSAVMAQGGILISDPIAVNVADGGAIFVRSYASVAAAGKWANASGAHNSASIGTSGAGALEGAVTNTDSVDSGTINGSSANVFGPSAIIARPEDQHRSILVVGDSIFADTGVITQGEVGYITRAAIAAGFPVLRIAQGGERVLTVVSQVNFWKRARLTQYATDAIVNYGTNDIYGSSRTLAQVKADLITLWRTLARAGLRVHQTTILPRPGASTDGYMTIAGQSITDSGKESVRTSLNTWLRDGTAVTESAGALASVIDAAALVEVNSSGVPALNGGKWAVPAGGVVKTGTATSVAASVITDTGAGRTTNADMGLVLAIMTATTGAAQSQEVASNTATAWSLLSALSPTPTGTVTYQLGHSYSYDGIHPTEEAHVAMGNAINLSTLA